MSTTDKSKVDWLKINKARAMIKMSSGYLYVLWDDGDKPFSADPDLYKLWVSQLELAIDRNFDITIQIESPTDGTVVSVISWAN
ncbi:MAG: hypothetical protein V3V99_06815 [candidate division Zixibacteria bacterium]